MLAVLAGTLAAAVPQPTIVQKPIPFVTGRKQQMAAYSRRHYGRQMAASLRLTRWLRCRYDIGVSNVIGHNENRSSPYHRERVDRLKDQTHGDWTASSMRTYRSRLAEKGAC